MAKAKEYKVFGYKTYNFREKDPIIDVIRTIVKDKGLDYNDIARDSGVHPTTLMAWIVGVTRRPQYATVAAVFRAMGYELQPQVETRIVPIQKTKKG